LAAPASDAAIQSIITTAAFKFQQHHDLLAFHLAPVASSREPTMAAPNILNTISRAAIPIFVGLSVAQAALYDVKGGTRAVIFDRLSGVQEKVVNEGTHFLVPWLQKAIIYDVRTKPRNISTTTGSKDLQMVSLTLRVLHRPEVQQLPKIYQVRQNNTSAVDLIR
jgi:regulator of protease activity HflC (stomatin/prohibitin superfamily)